MTYQVTLHDTPDGFEVKPGEQLLDAAERAGLPLEHDCRFGGCGACKIKLLEGSVDYEEQPFGLSEEEASQGYALACQARATSDLTIAAKLRAADYIAPDYHTATIESLEQLCHDVTHLVLRIPTAAATGFHPGQYLNVMLDDGMPRSFSMASPPRGELFDLHIRRVPGGRFTEKLYGDYQVGDTLDVELPLGEFRYRAQIGKPLLMVAGGTGLAPIKSIIESIMDAGNAPQIVLYWGVRQQRDLYFDTQLSALASQLPNFTYIPVLSEADTSWQGQRGFVHKAIGEDVADLSQFDAYLCGPPPMIAAAKEAFLKQGMDPDSIFSDSFNFTHELNAA